MHFLIGFAIVIGIIVFMVGTKIGRIIGGILLVIVVVLAMVAASNNAEFEHKKAQEQAAQAEAARIKQAQWDALTPAQQQKIRDDDEVKQHDWQGEVPCKADATEIANVGRFATALEFAYHPRVNWAVKAIYVGVKRGMSSTYNEDMVEKEAERLKAVYAAVMAGKKVSVSWCPKISAKNPPQYSATDPDPLMHISLFQLSPNIPESSIPPLPPFIR
jgi:hypothetical protein